MVIPLKEETMDDIAVPRTSAGTLIIGAGQAGLQLAASLRELGDNEPITIVGAETHAPYQRPPLSKAFLAGSASEQDLALRDAEFFAANAISTFFGECVTALALSEADRSVGKALTSIGRTVAFDRLAFAVGGTPRRLRVSGAELEGIHYLRTIDDAVALRDDLNDAGHVVVVGGGFVGLEIAAASTAKGKRVTVLEAQDRLMARAVAPEMSQFYAAAHTRRGARIELNAAVIGFQGDTRIAGVKLADGRIVPADVVVVGIGLIPRTELAKPLGLSTDLGIEVDEYGRTRIPGIVAAGDCAASSHPLHGRIRLESVPNAIAQAKTAAAALMGIAPTAQSLPWFWSDQADLKLQMAGLSMGYDRVVLRGAPESERFSALYYRDGQLASIESVNAPGDYMAARRILETGGNIPMDAARDLAVPLKTHFARL